MVGCTNAREVTGPDLTAQFNGYSQTMLDWLDRIQLQNDASHGKLGRMSDNPAVGSLIYCAGSEWLVVHREPDDDGGGLLYLATKNITGTCAEDIETPIVSFEALSTT